MYHTSVFVVLPWMFRCFVPRQEREIDQLVVADVCALKLPGVTPEKVAMAVQRRNKRADIRVAYELLLDSKKARHRKEGAKACALACLRVCFCFLCVGR